jgi:hypothetical protein
MSEELSEEHACSLFSFEWAPTEDEFVLASVNTKQEFEFTNITYPLECKIAILTAMSFQCHYSPYH